MEQNVKYVPQSSHYVPVLCLRPDAPTNLYLKLLRRETSNIQYSEINLLNMESETLLKIKDIE